MEWISSDAFAENLIRSDEVLDVVRDQLSPSPSYAFREDPEAEAALFARLAKRIGVTATSMRVVGSAKNGFSIAPEKFPAPFTDQSDIDLLIVDATTFDRIWMTILSWHYPNKGTQLPRRENRWMAARRQDIYWGWFRPSSIRYDGLGTLPRALLPLRDISGSWFDALHSLSLEPRFSRWNVTAVLYRTWEHAHFYQRSGLATLRKLLTTGESIE